MKKQLFALSLIATSGLFAANQDEQNEPNNYATNECCDPCKPCEPCCVPKPKKCIDCECYTPAFYDLQCDWGAAFFVDFLYWYAREQSLAYAMRFDVVQKTPPSQFIPDPPLAFAPNTYKYIDAAWDPGFRVGLGFNDSCDGWDWNVNWTYYRNRKKTSTSVPDQFSPVGFLPLLGDSALINPWINQSFQGLALPGNVDYAEVPTVFNKVAARWTFTFNQIDLELGRKYWLSKCFNLRPFTGIRGAWTKVKYRTTSYRDYLEDDSMGSIKYVDRNRVRYWGVGFYTGFEPAWYFCSNFALYGNFDIALLWGKHREKKKERYEQTAQALTLTATIDDYSNTSKGHFYKMQPMVDLGIGLRWEETWCCDRYRTALDLGWEHHDMINHTIRNKTVDHASFVSGTDEILSGFNTFDADKSDIMLGGFVARLRFDF